MKFTFKPLLFLVIGSFILINCSSDGDDPIQQDDDDPIEVSPVVFDISAVPYPNLSDYNFFKSPMNDLNPVYGVLPFEPASKLFTDYALKKRFVWMPENVSATIQADDQVLNFPVGTVLIKNFYYENIVPNDSKKIIETRLMIRKNEGWIFANYIWNDQQTEAVYNMDGAFLPLQWVQNGETKSINYRIPNENECIVCHKLNNNNTPIGPKPQNLNFALNYQNGNSNQLEKLKDFGYISNNIPQNIVSAVDYNDTSESLDKRARSYLDINCAHCHRNGGFAETYPLRLNYTETANFTALGFCQTPIININGYLDEGQEANHIIYPGDHNKSNLYYRMDATIDDGPLMMPYIGRSIKHQEAIEMIANWIDSFEEGCE